MPAVENQYLIFAGQQAHGVLEQQQQEHQEQQEQQEQWEQQEQPHQDTPPPPLPLPSQQRATLLVNWWARRPEGVERATEEEVQQGKLAAARESLELSVEEKQCSRQRRIQFTSIDAPPLQAGELLPVSPAGGAAAAAAASRPSSWRSCFPAQPTPLYHPALSIRWMSSWCSAGWH